MLSRRVIAYYGLIRASESLPATYEFAAESAAAKEVGLRWESRGSPIYSVGLCSRAASLTPVAPKSANDCCFLLGVSLHLRVTGSATTLVISRLQSSLRAYFALMLRPASWLALLSRTFTFERTPIQVTLNDSRPLYSSSPLFVARRLSSSSATDGTARSSDSVAG